MTENHPEPSDFPAYSPKWPTAPAGFAERVTAAVREQHRIHRRRVWLARAGGLALAASVAFAIILGVNGLDKSKPEVVSFPTTPATVPVPPKVEPVAPIQKPFAEAGEALAAMTKQTTDKALAPSKTMLASAEKLPLPNGGDPKMNVETKGLIDSTESARTGLDPVSSQPRKAVNRFLRDFGIATASKPKS